MSENSVRNSVTVSAKAKRQVGAYEPVEVMVSYTMALSDSAGIEEFNATEMVLYGEVVAQLEAQIADTVARFQGAKLDEAATAREEEERRPSQPASFPKPTHPPATAQNAPQAAPAPRTAPQGWTRVKYAPKAAERVLGQFWTSQVLSYEKGKFVGADTGKEYQALVITVKDGKFTRDIKIFHDAPAYPAENTPYRDFFVEGGKYNIADRNVYVVLGVTGKTYKDKLEAVALAFTTRPDEMPVLPALGDGTIPAGPDVGDGDNFGF